MLNLNVQGILGKLQKNVDKLGMIAGALAFGWEPLLGNAELLFTQGHIPNIPQTIRAMFEGHMGESMKGGIGLYIAGWIASDLGFKQGKLLQKGSEGYIKGLLIQHLLYWSTHSPKGHQRSEQSRYGVSSENPMEGVYA